MQHSELATELGNVRVDEVELERSDVAHEVVDELERANVDVDVGQMGPPNTYTGYKECVSANPRFKTNNSAAISTLNLTPIERGHIQQELCDFEDSSDDDYSCCDEDEYEDDSDLFAENIVYGLEENPNWELKAFKKRVNRELGCEVKYYKCYMAKRIAKKMIVGDASEEYSRVWDYAEAIRRFNPGSTAIMKCIGIDTPQPLFQRMPIISVDGAHLKGPFPGVLLTAVGKDGNNNIFPVAWAVVETENVETWTWFLNLLVEDLKSVNPSSSCVEAGCEDFTFMSDRQKGLIEALNSVIPEAEIRFYCRHIWANFKIKFPGELYKHHFWKAAKAYNKFHFDREMIEIKNISVEAYEYLAAIPVKHWSRHAFCSRSKSGMLSNNCCESFNNVLVEARGKPIISLMEWIRRYVMQRSASKREGLSNFKESYVVNLTNKTCLCGSWNLLGIPCKHAMACIVIRKLDPSEFVHEAYLVETYAKTYAPKFYGMPGHNM
ncbi:uncharacterized protein LOC130818607 [Amaranthus tricolor]|uniref:uncharacterized protein LOC130818607 n=1 Tax=Amaranthus tricolor TaxID=29722 RepID=UPI00258AF5B7|nr:uncharacterized protein LOC130818607 [Amaranthus tricolor]